MGDIKLGFLNSIRKDLSDTAAWAASVGFQTFELGAGPGAIVNVDKVLAGGASDVKSPCTDNAIEITSLTYCVNHLVPEGRDKNNAHMLKVIDAASQLDVGIVACFIGGTGPGAQMFNEMGLFEEFFVPLLDHAKEQGIKMAFENCPAGGTNIARSPYYWREVFAAVEDSPNLGIEFDPSHFVWMQVDYLKALDEFAGKVFLLHAKDTLLKPEILADRGFYEPGWWEFKIPGLGVIDWTALFSILKAHDFTGAINIELEDPAYSSGEERIKEGLLIGLKTLQDSMAASQ